MTLWSTLVSKTKSLFRRENTNLETILSPAGHAILASNKKTRFETVNRLKYYFGQSSLDGNFNDYTLQKLNSLESETLNIAKYVREQEIKRLKEQYSMPSAPVKARKVQDMKKTGPTIKIPALQEDNNNNYNDETNFSNGNVRSNPNKTYNKHISRANELLRLKPASGWSANENDTAEYHLRCANNTLPGTKAGLKLAEILIRSSKLDSAIEELNGLERLGLVNGKDGAYLYSLRAKANFWKGDFESTISDMSKSMKVIANKNEYCGNKIDDREFFLKSAMLLNGATRTKHTDAFAKKFLHTAKRNKNKNLTSRLYEYASKLTENTHEALEHAKNAVLYSEQHNDERYLSALQTLAESHADINQKTNAGLVLKQAVAWIDSEPSRQEEYQFDKNIMQVHARQYLQIAVDKFEGLCKEEDIRTQALALIRNGQKDHALAKKVYKLGKSGQGNATKLYQYAALLAENDKSALKCAKLAVKESIKNSSIEDKLTARQTLAELLLSADKFDEAKTQATLITRYLEKKEHHKHKYHRIYKRMSEITGQENWLV